MKTSEGIFEVTLGAGTGSLRKQLLVRPEQTTDGVPIYHCFFEGSSISQLRQEASGEWVQLWGDLSVYSIQQVGKAIADHLASTR
ncbi:hypothetical protein [Parapedobacter pyrenivorans]|uniref:hypothetical protein n=1 Tax=Parapedobacter pyrenivorans TaxID=1305674 RepID=UPI003340CCD5